MLQLYLMILDIAIGLLLGSYFNTGDEMNYLLMILAILFCLLPDIDIFYYLFKKYIKKVDMIEHRSWTHFPLVYVPVYFTILYIENIFNIKYNISTLFLLSIVWHFVHDTLFIGWGVMWGWPFSKRKYKIFPDRNGKVTGKLLLTWLPEDQENIIKWSGGSIDGWLRHYYFKFNIVSALEYGVFLYTFIYIYFKYFVV